ncbi:hypothetical protein G6F46_010109 [Rhizopus delemar]|nr:hypothetical protein G6F36_013518 [Rhizopus arrhizus]KAG1454277.1 hypothetical protein G6F55_007695 [Rhizopus delemar]KAG1491919.1 hypothetical protein G6F54_009673 [Rhizopus delemar]KAG1507913.1 hypothetical protein G6F53_008584 [Rhizopus delemar]KAG1521171.1 hypothetical protein G6F52_006981 [Rhizopus delemar]
MKQTPLSFNSITEEDGLKLNILDKTVGYVIKHAALESYNTYEAFTLVNLIVSLGFNSILDLTLKFGSNQSTLITKA